MSGPGPARYTEAMKTALVMFALTSSAFEPSGTIPKKYTCDGKNISPPLAWSGVPEGTRRVAVIMDDPDAPAGTGLYGR